MTPTASGGSATFLGAASYGAARADIGALYGTRFTNSGYTFSATLTPGAYVVTVYARNSATGVFNNSQTVSVTVAASSPNGLVEDPTPNQTLAQPFTMKGWVFDAGSSGVGIDRVQVYAYPNPGSDAPAIFVGDATIGISRPDVAAFAGPEHENAGFAREIRGLTPGAYQLVAVARSSVDGHEFWVPNPVTVTVQANPHMWVDTPTANSAVNQTFTVAGWGVDVAAASGTGVSTLHVWAYPSSGSPLSSACRPTADRGRILAPSSVPSSRIQALGSPRVWHRAPIRSSSMHGARSKTTSISPKA